MGFWRFGPRRKVNDGGGGVAADVWCAGRPHGSGAKVPGPLGGLMGSAGRGEEPAEGEPRLSDRFGAAAEAASPRGAGKGAGGACGGKGARGGERGIQ